jgi:hypothetical protein
MQPLTGLTESSLTAYCHLPAAYFPCFESLRS